MLLIKYIFLKLIIRTTAKPTAGGGLKSTKVVRIGITVLLFSLLVLLEAEYTVTLSSAL